MSFVCQLVPNHPALSKAMAATRARTELAASSASQNVKDITPSREVLLVDAAANDQTPARRTTTRTRKLPSRLLPSPSPPPSRPSSLFNAAKHSKGGKETSEHATVSSAKTSPSDTVTLKLRKTSKADGSNNGSDLETAVDKDDNLSSEDLGPGKRKRRPSSMYKPPSTLTAIETPSPASASSTSKSKKKGRSLSPEGSALKVQSPSVLTAQARLKSRLSKSAVTPLSRKVETHADRVQEDDSPRSKRKESEKDPETFQICTSKKVRLGEADDSADLSPPPLLPRDGSAKFRMPTHFTQPTFIRGGRVSVSPEASSKRPIKFGVREFSRPALSADEIDVERFRNSDIMRASKVDAQDSWKCSEVMSSSPISGGIAKFDSDSGVPLTYMPFRRGVDSAASFRNMRSTPFVNEAVIEEDEDEEDDDEDDFHQAMLDADFDFFDSQKSDSVASKPAWAAARQVTAEDVEMDDTPATTPRSPQSGCDLPSPGSPRCKTEEDVSLPSVVDKASSFDAGRDSVFVHALPTTQVGADKPYQHAGSLTLSLPYSPAVAASSPHLRAIDTDFDAAPTTKGVKDGLATTQTGTPVLHRRKHAGLPTEPHGLAPLKFNADLMERSASGTAPYMQLSPMIEIESPLLSPGLTLSLHSKGSDLPSPFVMGVGALPELEQPAPLALPPAEGSTTPKATNLEMSNSEVSNRSSVQPSSVETQTDAVNEVGRPVQPEKKVAELSKVAAKADKPSARRPALPPPRQIRFTTFTTPLVESTDSRSQQLELTKKTPTMASVPTQQQQTTQHHPSGGASTASSNADSMPDLVHSGSSSPDSASDSPSPMSQAGPATGGDAEVETILFGPPEKLDLHELDHAWGGSRAAQHEAALRRATKVTQIHHVDVEAE